MLKFDANDLKALEENSKQKLVLVENTYKAVYLKQILRIKL